jgi:hypothetical protein
MSCGSFARYPIIKLWFWGVATKPQFYDGICFKICNTDLFFYQWSYTQKQLISDPTLIPINFKAVSKIKAIIKRLIIMDLCAEIKNLEVSESTICCN